MLTVNKMSGQVIIARYISDPIISWYVVFLAVGKRVGKMDGESGVKSMPDSMGVTAGCALSRLKQV